MQEREQNQGSRPVRFVRFIAAALAFFVVGAGIAVYGMGMRMNQRIAESELAAGEQIAALSAQIAGMMSQSTSDYLQNTALTINSSDNDPVVAIAEKCKPSIVGVTNLVKQSRTNQGYGGYNNPFYPFVIPGYGDQQGQGEQGEQGEGTFVEYSFGSGIVVNEDGYILTNYHVIEGADKLMVTLYDGTEVEATLVGSDEYLDVALLMLNESVSGLVAVSIGDSDTVKVGEMAIAIGNPLGKELLSTVTMGVISASNRVIDVGDDRIIRTLQTDAAINSGNSGGGLFNSRGELIGITTLKMSSSYSDNASIEGLGFAIPINEAMNIANQLMDTGSVNRPALGINARNFTEDEAAQYNNLEAGIQIDSVQKGSPADAAGLQRLDIITAFNGERVTTLAELKSKLNYCKFGDTVKLTIIRDGKKIDVDVVLHSGSVL